MLRERRDRVGPTPDKAELAQNNLDLLADPCLLRGAAPYGCVMSLATKEQVGLIISRKS